MKRHFKFTVSSLQAWYRRGKANASLRIYEDALRDLNIAMNMEESLSGKRQIESELKLILDLCKETHSSVYKSDENDPGFLCLNFISFNN